MCRTTVIALSPPLRAGPQNTKPLPEAKYQTEPFRRRILPKLKVDRCFVFFGKPGAGVPLHDMSAFGPKRTCACAPQMSAFGGKADILLMSFVVKALPRLPILADEIP